MNDKLYDALYVGGSIVLAGTVIIGITMGIYWISNWYTYQEVKANCDATNGTLSYEGQKSNWIFTTDTWNCKSSTSFITQTITKSQTCFENGIQKNCSEMGV